MANKYGAYAMDIISLDLMSIYRVTIKGKDDRVERILRHVSGILSRLADKKSRSIK